MVSLSERGIEPRSQEQETKRPHIFMYRRFPKEKIDVIKDLLPEYQKYHNIDESYVVGKLGATTLYEESADPEQQVSGEQLALQAAQVSGLAPDIIYFCSSYLPTDPKAQRKANITRALLARYGYADEEKTPANTHTFSAACSSTAVAFDRVRELNPEGKRVMLISDETGYRRSMPPTAFDTQKAGLLFSDAQTVWIFPYGKNGLEVVASEIHRISDTDQCLTMPVPEVDPHDPYITSYAPPYSEYFGMNGPALKREFGRKITQRELARVLLAGRVHITGLDFFTGHQASIRMEDYFNNFFEGVLYKGEGIKKYGNTSSASTLLDMEDGINEGKITPGSTGLVVQYGGGLTWGACVLRFGKTT